MTTFVVCVFVLVGDGVCVCVCFFSELYHIAFPKTKAQQASKYATLLAVAKDFVSICSGLQLRYARAARE